MSTELRKWAIEQAVKLHGANGVTTDVAIGEAAKLMEFVEPSSGQGQQRDQAEPVDPAQTALAG